MVYKGIRIPLVGILHCKYALIYTLIGSLKYRKDILSKIKMADFCEKMLFAPICRYKIFRQKDTSGCR